MARTILNILDGFGSLFSFGVGPDLSEQRFSQRLRGSIGETRDQYGDYGMVMLDMRRVMLFHLDMIPHDEQQRIREALDAGRTFQFETELGLDSENSERLEPGEQLLPYESASS